MYKRQATEIVIDGENGFLVADEEEMAEATARLHTIDPRRCRASVASRYDGPVVARHYVAAYRAACNGTGSARLDLRTSSP